MFQIDMKYFRRDGSKAGHGSYSSKAESREETRREIENLRDGGNLPGLGGRFHDVLVSAEVILLGHGVANSLVVIPEHWLAEYASQAEHPYTPTTNEVLDKATAITQQADTLCETLVCTALSLHGVMGFKGGIGREHKRAASTTGFLKSAILSNLCLRQYTATGDELALVQCLIPLFKDK